MKIYYSLRCAITELVASKHQEQASVLKSLKQKYFPKLLRKLFYAVEYCTINYIYSPSSVNIVIPMVTIIHISDHEYHKS